MNLMYNPPRIYGYIKDEEDPRDLLFKPKVTHIEVPLDLDLRNIQSPVRDQDSIGCCTGFGITSTFDVSYFKKHKKFLNPSPLFVYYLERVLENSVNQDAGAQIRDGIKCLTKYGVCSEKAWPYDVNKIFTKPVQAAYKEALGNKIISYERLTSLIQVKQAHAEKLSVVFGMTVFESFESDEVARTGKVPMPKSNEKILGGHCVHTSGHFGSRHTELCKNSWSKKWGMGGYFELPDEYFTSGLVDDMWIIKITD
jgi:C1A family cysteine protease